MRRALAFAFLGLLVALQPVGAAPQIGVAIDAKLRVTNVGAGGSKVLITSAPVFTNDRLVANSTGLAQIRFVDDTKLVLGPNSNVTLDRFVFSGESSAKAVSVSVTKGAFRFISGRSGSRAYAITTPAGSIGVRGTAFDVSVKGGTTSLLLLRGQVNVCPRDGACRVMRQRCGYIAFNRRGFIQRNSGVGRLDPQRVRSLFPLLTSGSAILPQFQGGAAACRGSIPQTGTRNARATTPTTQRESPVASPSPPSPAPVSDKPAASPAPTPNKARPHGNPGNTKAMGKAGFSPNGRDFGALGHGRSNAHAAGRSQASSIGASASGWGGGVAAGASVGRGSSGFGGFGRAGSSGRAGGPGTGSAGTGGHDVGGRGQGHR
ncbi:FecR family protein [Pseudaminobacter sp. NGMCC 1.201702]|uniref:FecR family protein n=1 Tax=Pseudaminobacter sp. NGMCC 1.201702 TaxID=3391825 RepID=UPI0039EFAF33